MMVHGSDSKADAATPAQGAGAEWITRLAAPLQGAATGALAGLVFAA